MSQSIFCVIPLQSPSMVPKRFIFVHGDFFEITAGRLRSDPQFRRRRVARMGKPSSNRSGRHESKMRLLQRWSRHCDQSQIVEGTVDGFTGQIPRALEGHVFQKVTDTHQLRRFIRAQYRQKAARCRDAPRSSRPRSAGRCQVGAGDGPRPLMVPTSWSLNLDSRKINRTDRVTRRHQHLHHVCILGTNKLANGVLPWR